MTSTRSLTLGFSLILTLLVALAGFAYFHLKAISNNVKDLYQHPFAVSNAGQRIEANILAIHRDMKDLVLLETPEQVSSIVDQISQREQDVLEAFDIIFDRFLGDKKDISKTYSLFLDWRPIRNDVLRLHSMGQQKQAIAITKAEGAEHVAKLQASVHEFVLFAENKAKEFYQASRTNNKESIFIISVIGIVAVALSFVIAMSVVRTIGNNQKESLQQSHLIDQNIMYAQLDLQGNIVSVSSALCRFLQATKAQLLNTPSFFFDNSEHREDLANQVWRQISTGKQWEGEISFINEDMVQCWAKSTILPKLDAQYAVVGYTNLLTDTTSKKLSVTDPLTNLPNRRLFNETLERELGRAYRLKSHVTLAIVDVDYFKLFNDKYGHPQGDKVLQQVAEAMRTSLKRPGDYVFRVGGEEFAIVLTDTDATKVKSFLDSVRVNIESLQIAHQDSQVSDYITISIGACSTEEEQIDAKEFYSKADSALYMAKHNRNDVVIA